MMVALMARALLSRVGDEPVWHIRPAPAVHPISLSSRGSGRLDTRLDTPPSIPRRHPVSVIAPGNGEGVVGGGVHGQGPLRRPRRLEAMQLPLPSSHRDVRTLGPVIHALG